MENWAEWCNANPRHAWMLERIEDEAQRLLLKSEIMRKGTLTEQSMKWLWDLANQREQGRHGQD